jgi:chromatin assembly factor 1 subunit B
LSAVRRQIRVRTVEKEVQRRRLEKAFKRFGERGRVLRNREQPRQPELGRREFPVAPEPVRCASERMPTAAPVLQAWHGKDKGDTAPVFSLDFQIAGAVGNGRLATGGADNKVRIWKVHKQEDKTIDFLATLSGHDKAVNIVRFSPNGHYLATSGDDGTVLIWTLSTTPVSQHAAFGADQNEVPNKENWRMVGQLRGNSQDVYDLSWSPDSKYLISGSHDKHAIVFDVNAGKVAEVGPHMHNVQGVAWDTRNNVLCTLSGDRGLRVFNRRKPYNRFLHVSHLGPAVSPVSSPVAAAPAAGEEDDVEAAAAAAAAALAARKKAEAEKKALQQRLFADETIPTFFRRLAWSPDGTFLVVPCGQIKADGKDGKDGPLTAVAHVFARDRLDRPAMCLPTFPEHGSSQGGSDPAVVVRFNPNLYTKRDGSATSGSSAAAAAAAAADSEDDSPAFFNLPYRVVFAVASLHSVAVYDTSTTKGWGGQPEPIAVVQGLHCSSITDLSWSADGNTLAVSSHDGFCSLVRFERGELGEKLPEKDLPESMTEAWRTKMAEAFKPKPRAAPAAKPAAAPAAAAASSAAADSEAPAGAATTTAEAACAAPSTAPIEVEKPATATVEQTDVAMDVEQQLPPPKDQGADGAEKKEDEEAEDDVEEDEEDEMTEEDKAFLGEEDDGPIDLNAALAAAAPALLPAKPRPAAAAAPVASAPTLLAVRSKKKSGEKRRMAPMQVGTAAASGPSSASAAAAAEKPKKRRVALVPAAAAP